MARTAFLAAAVLLAPSAILIASPQEKNDAEIPAVKAGAGSCTADFVVTNLSGKGVYNAKIRIKIRYGFLGLHRLELEAATNADGKARFEELPEKVKSPVNFQVSHGDVTLYLLYEPRRDCHPRYEVLLPKKPAN